MLSQCGAECWSRMLGPGAGVGGVSVSCGIDQFTLNPSITQTTESELRQMAKKSRKRTTRTRRPASTGSGLANISLSDLRAELTRRQRAARPLLQRRERLMQQLTDIDGQLAAHGIDLKDATSSPAPTMRPRVRSSGSKSPRKGGGRRGPRGNNSANLVDSLQKVLTGKQMAVKDVVEAVQSAGYKTKSANFRTIVNQALTARTDVFKKVSRGVYTAK